MAEGDGANGAAAAKAVAAKDTKDTKDTKDAAAPEAKAPAVDEADVLEEDDDFEEFEEDRTFLCSCQGSPWGSAASGVLAIPVRLDTDPLLREGVAAAAPIVGCVWLVVRPSLLLGRTGSRVWAAFPLFVWRVSFPLLTIPLPSRVSLLCCDLLSSPIFFPLPPMQAGWRRLPRQTAPRSGSGKTTGTTKLPTMTLSAGCARSWRRTCRRRPPRLAARRRPSRPSTGTLYGGARRGATLAGGERTVAGRPPAVGCGGRGFDGVCIFFLFLCVGNRTCRSCVWLVWPQRGSVRPTGGHGPRCGCGRDRRHQQDTKSLASNTTPTWATRRRRQLARRRGRSTARPSPLLRCPTTIRAGARPWTRPPWPRRSARRPPSS